MKGISFVAAMAVAVLAGRKTVTRRLIKPKHEDGVITGAAAEPGCAIESWGGGAWHKASHSECLSSDYMAGERRCLLTTWAVHRDLDKINPKSFLAVRADRFWHAGTGPKPEWCGKSRPGRFLPNTLRHLMPVLEIVSVSVERLQDITEEDAISEGAHRKLWITSTLSAGAMGARGKRGTHREGFKEIWEDINGAGSWARNPFVWVIGFRKLP